MNTTGRATLLLAWFCTLPLACELNGDGAPPTLGEADIERTTEALTQGTIAQSLLDAWKQSLKVDLLDPYYPTAHDGSYGGFVEDRSGTWALQQDSDKFVSLQARLTWTAAKASQFYASNPTLSAQYLASAGVGFQFLTRMWRGSTTGFAMMSDRSGGNLRDTGKETYVVYGNAFGLYAAAAYYAASGDANALTLAINAYNYLDDYFYDSQYGGYYITTSDKRKDTNTNVHVFEALIELYKDMPTSHALRSEVASRVSQLLGRFHDSALHCPATNDCFAYPVMNQDWTASTSDVSFGHDLELSMLMVEAITALGGDPVASPYIAKIKKVVDFTFTHGGYRSDGGLYYTGTYSGGNITINDSQLQWWPQAEGLGALCLMRSLYPADTLYEPTISKSWSYIDAQFIDDTNHGWVRQAGDWNIAKGWEWHCNYHNGRALLNCLTWLTGSTPTPTCSDGILNQGETGVDCGGPCPACPTGNAVWIEAEAGTRSGSPTFAVNADSAASGGSYIQPTTNSPSSAGPNRASYTFTAAAGTYKVWGRVISPTADDDSFWVSMDGGAFVMWNSIPTSATWAWDDVHNSNNGGAVMTYALAQGSHTLVIANREDGVKLDKLYITALGDTPSGLGGGTPCVPTTCSALGAVCGTVSDGCGNTLSCGTCGTGQVCTANQCVCAPNTCASLGAVCGTASDGCGNTLSCGTCPTGETCNASNQCVSGSNTAPVVNVGADRTVTLPATVTINASVTDDGLPAPVALTMTWSKTSGPGTATFNPANAATTTISFSAAGAYVLRLTASDGVLSGYDEVQVTVGAANTAPVVNAGADRTVTLPSTLTIAGTVTDDGLPTPPALTVAWSKTSGAGTATFTPANAATTTVTFSTAGTYVLRLTAGDGALSAFDEVQVTVSSSGGTPCDGICTSPTSFTISGSYSSGNLGTGVVCRQTTSVVHSGNCGNFASPRTLSVNGTQMTCNGGSWASVPAARNGGYCISTTSGNQAWAYFTAW